MKLNENFDKLIKKEKRKKVLKTIGISLATTLVVVAVGTVAINKRMASQGKKVRETMDIVTMIQAPNIESFSKSYRTKKSMSAQMVSERFKNIDGYKIVTAPIEVQIDLFEINGNLNSLQTTPTSKELTTAINRKTGQKVPLFFNPDFDPKYDGNDVIFDKESTHEAKTLSELTNHVAEVAVSFNEPMTYQEIQASIPKDLVINWYWIGTNANKFSTLDLMDLAIGLNADTEGKLSDEALKTKETEEWYPSSYPSFVAAVKKAAGTESLMASDGWDIYQDALKQVKKYPTLDKAKFAGVIVSGRTENLAKLDDLPFVYATNVGVETEILPYMQPIK
ncbi:anti-sigma factor C-terminal domain-containing protein [Pseudolactococcus yaeyamensis]